MGECSGEGGPRRLRRRQPQREPTTATAVAQPPVSPPSPPSAPPPCRTDRRGHHHYCRHHHHNCDDHCHLHCHRYDRHRHQHDHRHRRHRRHRPRLLPPQPPPSAAAPGNRARSPTTPWRARGARPRLPVGVAGAARESWACPVGVCAAGVREGGLAAGWRRACFGQAALGGWRHGQIRGRGGSFGEGCCCFGGAHISKTMSKRRCRIAAAIKLCRTRARKSVSSCGV